MTQVQLLGVAKLQLSRPCPLLAVTPIFPLQSSRIQKRQKAKLLPRSKVKFQTINHWHKHNNRQTLMWFISQIPLLD